MRWDTTGQSSWGHGTALRSPSWRNQQLVRFSGLNGKVHLPSSPLPSHLFVHTLNHSPQATSSSHLTATSRAPKCASRSCLTITTGIVLQHIDECHLGWPFYSLHLPLHPSSSLFLHSFLHRARKGYLSLQELRSLIKELMPSVAEGDLRYFQVTYTFILIHTCSFVVLPSSLPLHTCLGFAIDFDQMQLS